MTGQLTYSEACERNKQPILKVLSEAFASVDRVLEIGSGTGQHAVFFASQLPHLKWQPTDTGEYLAGLRARVDQAMSDNLDSVVEVDVRMQPWPVSGCNGLFSANSLHFMSVECVVEFFRGVGEVLEEKGILVVYGPFRYRNAFTSESNAHFDILLKQTDPERGIKDFEWVDELAAEQGLQLLSDTAMPANNQTLVWMRDP